MALGRMLNGMTKIALLSIFQTKTVTRQGSETNGSRVASVGLRCLRVGGEEVEGEGFWKTDVDVPRELSCNLMKQ
jgi:hypothetical protein